MTEGAYSESLIDFLDAAERRDPEAVFAHLIGLRSRATLTVGELADRSRRVAQLLREAGRVPGDLALILHETGPNLLAGFLGAMMAGLTPAIMPPPSKKQPEAFYWSFHAQLFDRIEPKALIVSSSLADVYAAGLPGFRDRLMVVSDPILKTVDPAPATPSRGEAVAFLQHSSGTTALKKGVMLSHKAVIDQVRLYSESIGLRSGDVIASWLPLYHDMGLIACFMMPLVVGCPIAWIDPFEWLVRPLVLFEAIEVYGARYCWLPNFAFRHLANSLRPGDSFDLSRMRAFINCSEPCKPATHRSFLAGTARLGVVAEQVQVCYAMAENVFAVTQTALARAPGTLSLGQDYLTTGQIDPGSSAFGTELLSCGPPLPGVGVRIVDDRRGSLPNGKIGEIALTSPTLFSGYHRLPQQTARVLLDNEYLTGDLGLVWKGELYVVGRKDDMIIVYGRNFLAHELEAIVCDVPGVKPGRAVAVGVARAAGAPEELAVLYELDEGHEEVTVSSQIHLRLEAGSGATPSHIISRPRGSLIKTTSGKISRSLNKSALEGELRATLSSREEA